MTNSGTGPAGPPSGSAPAPQSYTCPWCSTTSTGTSLSCPACGAAVNVKAVTTHSGWIELPGAKDMARIQFGASTCQIEGNYVPVADLNLAPEARVYFTHHVLLWKDPQVTLDTLPLQGGWNRLLAGMPLIMLQAHGPGHIAFSRDAPGEMVALPLHAGQAVDVREHVFMVATGEIAYSWFSVYPLVTNLDRFYAQSAPGLLLLHGAGNVFIRHLAPKQTILVKAGALLFKDAAVEMRLTTEYVGRSGPVGTAYGSTWGERYHWLRLYGPGRVAVQSAAKGIDELVAS
ncbi:MAG TPA: AIM24 family protein [Chloroflexia bacterium]|nr:AIM24 family protein [Chloroflexia bacterium]